MSTSFTHKVVTLKCCIDSDEQKKDCTKKIKLPSKSKWDENLKSILSRIPKKFPTIAKMNDNDWLIQINGKKIDKKNAKQFGIVLSSTSPPVMIEITENIQEYILNIHYNNDSFIYNKLGSTHDIKKWSHSTFSQLISSIRNQYYIESNFNIFADKPCTKHNILNLDTLKKAFANNSDKYNLAIYVKAPNQLNIQFASNSFFWKTPKRIDILDEKQWNDHFNTLKNEISTQFNIKRNEFELRDDVQCLIKSEQDLMATCNALMNDKLSNIQDIKVIFKQSPHPQHDEDEKKEKESELILNRNDIEEITNKLIIDELVFDELNNKIPFISKQTCYDIIKDVLRHNNEVSSKPLESEWKLNWEHITNCVGHEMWNNLSSTIKSVIDNDKNGVSQNDMNQKTVDNVLQILKREKNLAAQETQYLSKLIQRARTFDPIHTANNMINNWNGQEIRNNNNDPDGNWNCNELNISTLNDIFNFHRAFIFSNYHFKEFTASHFMSDLNNNQFLGAKHLKNIVFKPEFNFYPHYLINDDLFEIIKYVFGISHYVKEIESNGPAAVAEEDDYDSDDDLDSDDDKSDAEHADNITAAEFRLYSVIIPQQISCVYDNNLLFKPSIDSIDKYLLSKKVYNFHRNIVRLNELNHANDIKKLLIEYYNLYDIKQDKTKQIMIIIDRRHLNNEINDILYLFSTQNINMFTELQSNYFIGFDFYVSFGDVVSNNVTRAYLRYGIGDKLRFYPEFLTQIVPRLFIKSNAMSEAQFLDNIYDNNYKHGFCLKLNDDLFNKYYKMITNHTFVSLNYNRNVVFDDYKYDDLGMLLFSDILTIQLAAHIQNDQLIIKQFNEYLIENEYDSDAILFDIGEAEANQNNTCFIKNYFTKNDQIPYWLLCRDWMKKLSHKTIATTLTVKNKENCSDLSQCPYIKYIIDSLTTFESLSFYVSKENLNKFDISYLSEAYDHIISVHGFCRKNSRKHYENATDTADEKMQEEGLINDVKKYVYGKLGECSHKSKCSVLLKHSHRKQMNQNEAAEEEANNNDNINNFEEMVNGTAVHFETTGSKTRSQFVKLHENVSR